MASEDAANREFGVVLFDDPKDPRDAWAFSPDHDNPWRISSPDELSTGTIWWSNVNYEFFFRKTEAWRRSWLRHDKYMVISHPDCLREWGYDPKTVTPNFLCVFAARVFSRVMNVAFYLARQIEPRMRMDELFTGTTLRHDLRRLLPEPEYPKGEAASIMQSGQAFDEFTVTGMRPPRDSKHYMFRKPRLLYAMEMLQTPIPAGPFEHYTRSKLRSVGDRAAWVRDNELPVIAEIAVEMKNQDVAPVFGFGNSSDKDKKSKRSWVSHPEFTVIERLGEVDVRAAYVGREYQALIPQLPEAVTDFLTEPMMDLSWTAGIIAETIWRAATLNQEKSKVGSLREGEDKAGTSWQGAWVKSADKVSMFLSANRLAEAGHAVLSYGMGWIRVAVTDEQVGDLLRDALSIGLVPNMHDVPEGMFDPNRNIPWGGDKRSQGLAHYQVNRMLNRVWNLDRLPLIPAPKRKEFLAELNRRIKDNEL